MKLKRKLIILVILLAGFTFGVSFSTLYAQVHIVEGTACSCFLPIPLLIPTFSSLGIFIGSIVYYLMMPNPEGKEAKDQKVFLELLEPNERQVISMILENGGEVTQSKISREIGKVKAFRLLETLRRRGIIEKEPRGKTNVIKLKEKFRVLCS